MSEDNEEQQFLNELRSSNNRLVRRALCHIKYLNGELKKLKDQVEKIMEEKVIDIKDLDSAELQRLGDLLGVGTQGDDHAGS